MKVEAGMATRAGPQEGSGSARRGLAGASTSWCLPGEGAGPEARSRLRGCGAAAGPGQEARRGQCCCPGASGPFREQQQARGLNPEAAVTSSKCSVNPGSLGSSVFENRTRGRLGERMGRPRCGRSCVPSAQPPLMPACVSAAVGHDPRRVVTAPRASEGRAYSTAAAGVRTFPELRVDAEALGAAAWRGVCMAPATGVHSCPHSKTEDSFWQTVRGPAVLPVASI